MKNVVHTYIDDLSKTPVCIELNDLDQEIKNAWEHLHANILDDIAAQFEVQEEEEDITPNKVGCLNKMKTTRSINTMQMKVETAFLV